MFKNYFKTAWRNLIRNKTYATLNIVGLSLGIACSILIFTIVSYHLSFDQFNKNKDRIYRIVTEIHAGNIFYSRGTPSPLAKAISNDYTFTDKVARVNVFWKASVTIPSAESYISTYFN